MESSTAGIRKGPWWVWMNTLHPRPPPLGLELETGPGDGRT